MWLNARREGLGWLNQLTVQREEGEFLVVEYSIVAESLVTFTELKKQGLSAEDLEGLLAFAKNKEIDITIVGTEAPLVLGRIDLFEKKTINLF